MIASDGDISGRSFPRMLGAVLKAILIAYQYRMLHRWWINQIKFTTSFL